MLLQWHGEGDGVQPKAFRPTEFRLTLEYGDEKLQVVTTATPDIQSDPKYMRQTIAFLVDRLREELGKKGDM